MRPKPVVATARETTTIRIAWWASLLATLTLIALLGMARSAQALSLSGSNPIGIVAAVVPPGAAEEEDEGEAEASEDEELEAEECVENEEEECEEVQDGPAAPAECLLSSAEATVFAVANRNRLRLQIRYTASAPVSVAVAYALRRADHLLFLGGEKSRLGKKGVLLLSRNMTDAQMAKVMAAKAFKVWIRAIGAPGWCRSLFDRQLTMRRTTPSGLSWQERE